MSAAVSYDSTLPESERRDHGVHYTPEEMAAEVVHHTLDRLFVEHAATSNFIRSMRVGDMAMGGGVFLVEVVRYLADKLVAAWEREGVELPEPLNAARHCVAESCIFGVELDSVATENAQDAVANFVGSSVEHLGLDRALRTGDALVGLMTPQICALDWEGPQDSGLLSPYFAEVVAADEVGTKLAADCVVGAFFAHTKGPPRRKELAARQPVILRALKGDEVALETARGWQEKILAAVPVFHWWLELPHLFSSWSDVPSKIDAFVGNPPFVGGGNISRVNGSRYLDWLKDQYVGAGGRTDLSAYFFRRAYGLMGRGAMGLIATNTISQGDTREGGLKVIVDDGGRIFRAHIGERWPGTANVTVSTVFISKHSLAPDEDCVLR